MMFGMTGKGLGRSGQILGACALGIALSGCGLGGFMGSDSTTTSSTQLANASTSQSAIEQAAPNALPAIATECPPIQVRAGGEALYGYEGRKVGDPRSLNFQAVIDKQSRNCVVSNGLITVKMGVVGRLLLGPAGSKRDFNLPLRFVVERDQQAVFSEKYDIPVKVTAPSQSEEFVKVVENVAIPYIGGEEIIIWVGFDTKA